MARIPLFPLEVMTEAQRLAYEKASSGPVGPIKGPSRAMLHNPELAEKWRALGDLLRFRTSLPLNLSELAILVTARHWTAQFIWHTHVPPALKGGLDPAIIEAIREERQPVFTRDEEAVVYDYCSELLQQREVGEATYQRALALLGAAGLVELTAIAGYYSMTALTVNAHGVLPDAALPLAAPLVSPGRGTPA